MEIMFHNSLKIPILIIFAILEIITLICFCEKIKTIKNEKEDNIEDKENKIIKKLKKMISSLHIFEFIIAIYYFLNSVLNWRGSDTIYVILLVIIKIICYTVIKKKNIINIKNEEKIYKYIAISIIVFYILISLTGHQYDSIMSY